MSDDARTLVVYFSHEGNTKFVAEAIAKETGADILPLAPKKEQTSKSGPGKFFWGGSKVFMRTKPELKKFSVDPEDYDVLFIGTPVWSWTFSPPLRTFFDQYDLKGKQVALFACHEGGLRQTFTKMKKAMKGGKVIGEFDHFAPVKAGKKKDCEKKLKKWLDDLSY